MEAIPQILLYVIGTYITFRDIMHLSLSSKHMNKKAKEARRLLAKREVMRIFSSDLHEFRVIIHSISYELGPQDLSIPTLSDGYDWLEILKEGLEIMQSWPKNLKSQLRGVYKSLQNPESNLPSFHFNSSSRLDTIMQENLFEVLNKNSKKLNFPVQNIEFFEFENFNSLESIYLLNSYNYVHDGNVIANTPKISQMAQFHYAFLSTVKYCCKIHRISIFSRLGLVQIYKKIILSDTSDAINNCSENKLGEKDKAGQDTQQLNIEESNKPITIYSSKSGEFLYEYAVRWTAFSHSIWKISQILTSFQKNLVDGYNEMWPENNNKFGIYRMMTRIWSKEVLTSELLENMKEMFKVLIQEYHKNSIEQIRDK